MDAILSLRRGANPNPEGRSAQTRRGSARASGCSTALPDLLGARRASAPRCSSSRASAAVESRRIRFRSGIANGAIDSSPMPSATRIQLCSGSPAISPHIPTDDARAPRGLADALDHAQVRGVQRLVQVGDLLVRAVDRERVLQQVVGPDRQEVGAAARSGRRSSPRPASRSSRRAARRGRRRAARARSSRLRVLERGARVLDLGQARDHRDQDLQLAERARAEQRAQLRCGTRRAGGATCARRAGRAPGSPRRESSSPRRHLLAADVERADRRRVRRDRREDRARTPRAAPPRPAGRGGSGTGTRCGTGRCPRRRSGARRAPPRAGRRSRAAASRTPSLVSAGRST